MMRNQIVPLRTNVGNAIEISNVQIIDRSSSVFNTSILDIKKINSYSQSEEFDYSMFMPDPIKIAGEKFKPIEGTAKLKTPLPYDTGFSRDINAIFTAILLRPSTGVKSRDLFIEMEVSFTEKKLVGGICYFGFPYLPYYITKQGENSANFGLPREIKISWENESSQFIDDESSMVIQEPVSHSGVHFLSIDPIKTDKIKLRFSDWPEFITGIEVVENDGKIEKKLELKTESTYGLLLPSLIVYEHKESSRYKPHVPLGILACKKIDNSGNIENDTEEIPLGRSTTDLTKVLDFLTHKLNADYIYFINKPYLLYFNHSAASITGQKRRFKSYIENFVSSPLKSKEAIQLYIEQAVENDRCIAGIKIKFAAVSTLPGQSQNHGMEIKIYEIDFPEGVSPISPGKNPDKDKYFTLIYSGNLSNFSAEHICRFLRSSLSRYFLINFQNTSDQRSQLRIDTLEIIQSAHVAITPRASKIQRIESINFRLIGENLADDYSKLGDEGFSIAVESINAGQRRDLLFSADNLLTLLNSGAAKIFSNYRREEVTREVSEEKITTHAGSKDIHSTSVDSKGWRRNETGKDVRWTRDLLPDLSDDEFNQSTYLLDKFDSFGTSENRTHNEQLAYEPIGDIVENFDNFLRLLFGDLNNIPQPWRWLRPNRSLIPHLWRKDDNDYEWKNIWMGGFNDEAKDEETYKDTFYIGLTSNLILPPYLPPALISAASGSFQKLGKWIKDLPDSRNFTLPEGPDISEQITLMFPTDRSGLSPFVNGLSMGINVGFSCFVGGGVSFSSQQMAPSLFYNSAKGSTGNIARQASKTGYNYSQILNLMYEKSRVISVFDECEMRRTVERSLNPSKERRRGVEVMWQDRYVDIITGKIPLGITLPATAKNYYEGIDQSIRVRFGGKIGQGGVEVDVWFDVLEETIKEDY